MNFDAPDDFDAGQASPLANIIAASNRRSELGKENSGSFQVARNLQQASTPLAPAPLLRAIEPRSPQRPQLPSVESQKATRAESSCDVCFGKHEQKNAVKQVDLHLYQSYSSVEMVDRTSGGLVIQPFSDVLQRLQRSVEGSSSGDVNAPVQIAFCRKCERQLQTLLSLRRKKKREREINTIYSSFFRRKERAMNSSSQQHTVQTIKCFMHGKGSVDCADGGHYRPLRLDNRSQAIRKAWRDHFAQKAGVGSFLASELLHNCCDQVLCPSHTSLMSNCLLFFELLATRCSICHRQEKKRRKQEVKVMDHESLQKNEDVMCLVEDALAVYTDNAVRLSDVKQPCAPC